MTSASPCGVNYIGRISVPDHDLRDLQRAAIQGGERERQRYERALRRADVPRDLEDTAMRVMEIYFDNLSKRQEQDGGLVEIGIDIPPALLAEYTQACAWAAVLMRAELARSQIEPHEDVLTQMGLDRRERIASVRDAVHEVVRELAGAGLDHLAEAERRGPCPATFRSERCRLLDGHCQEIDEGDDHRFEGPFELNEVLPEFDLDDMSLPTEGSTTQETTVVGAGASQTPFRATWAERHLERYEGDPDDPDDPDGEGLFEMHDELGLNEE